MRFGAAAEAEAVARSLGTLTRLPVTIPEAAICARVETEGVAAFWAEVRLALVLATASSEPASFSGAALRFLDGPALALILARALALTEAGFAVVAFEVEVEADLFVL